MTGSIRIGRISRMLSAHFPDMKFNVNLNLHETSNINFCRAEIEVEVKENPSLDVMQNIHLFLLETTIPLISFSKKDGTPQSHSPTRCGNVISWQEIVTI